MLDYDYFSISVLDYDYLAIKVMTTFLSMF